MTGIAEVRGHNIAARLAGQLSDVRCQIASTVCMKGHQIVRVEARAPSGGLIRDGVISLRLGNLLLYLEDRDALASLVLAVGRAQQIQQTAFGPDLPPPMFAPKKVTTHVA